ncbi:MAG TPA: type I-E CRISPR-associated protein Cas7/Cse4/CasC [Dermatophilaceae bacterium]|nr:type I-E CRISPR-associated protein Cas7/Cse4/CasC [Dermatophilaceae bacterium]
MNRLFIDIHVLQTVPPSNLNRDDTGSPKSAFYGGVRRARVSSQAWKRATRAEFGQRLDKADLGVRTKRSVELIADILEADHGMERDAAVARASAALEAMGLKPKVGKAPRGSTEPPVAQTDYLIFFSRRQLERIAAVAAVGEKPTKKDVTEAMDREHGIEVGLFGRMVADNKELSVDASVQVAHAISTHAVEDESDYFTAVDDVTQDEGEETGAGMLGTVEFNSATLYRYATLNVEGLQANLGDPEATARAAAVFVGDFVRSMPTGKQNTFANRTTPDGVVVMLREDQPVNLVGAFEQAVRANGAGGRVEESAKRLAAQAQAVRAFVDEPAHTFVVTAGAAAEPLAALGATMRITELCDRVEAAVSAYLGADRP